MSEIGTNSEILKKTEVNPNTEAYKMIKPEGDVNTKDVTQSGLKDIGIKRMEQCIQVEFNKCPENLDPKEYARQLKGQERGLNSMTIDKWLENRRNYLENGRSVEGNEAQKIQRQKALQSRIETNQKKGMSYAEAKKEANSWIETQAALHNPDQIAGGDPDKVSRMGDAGVNKSIGSQWKSRVPQLEQAIMEYAKGKSKEELMNTKLNIKLVEKKDV